MNMFRVVLELLDEEGLSHGVHENTGYDIAEVICGIIRKGGFEFNEGDSFKIIGMTESEREYHRG
jgi:hypothetical protein